MTSKSSLFAGAALGIVCALSFGGMASAATAKHKHVAKGQSVEEQVKALQAQVDSLQQTVLSQAEAQRSAQAQNEAALQASEQKASAAAAQAQQLQAKLDMQIQQIPGAVDSQVKTAVKDSLPKPGNVKVTMGGFAAAEAVYRSKQNVADIGSNFSKIPYDNNPLAHLDETRFTGRQSRLSVLVQGDVNPTTHAAFYGEFDFLGAAQTANSNESNSYNPRIRHVYGTVDWDDLGVHLLAGQNWSLTTMNGKGITPRNEVIPPTIEAQYAVGFVWARQPQIRITKDLMDKQLWLAASLENSQTTFGAAATGTSTTAAGVTSNVSAAGIGLLANVNNFSYNHLPDAVVKAAFEPDIGGARPVHVEAFGVFRQFYDRVTYAAGNALAIPATVTNKTTEGSGFGAGVTWTVVPKILDVQASGLVGKGIGRYGSGQLPDVIPGTDGSLRPIKETMYLIGATLHATPTLDLYTFWGQEKQEKAGVTQIGTTFFGYGNPNANLAGCLVEGGACSPDTKQESQINFGLWDRFYQGKFGNLRIGLQYSHIELEAFSGLNGVRPKTSDDMVFTSFRYYPNF
ncbi:MAG: hypothetical protein JSR98_21890 [Proteobacteria bacterium]|nr:hypothetical protein [Pseudomonadota bacterium]